jgi:hypothetical protein
MVGKTRFRRLAWRIFGEEVWRIVARARPICVFLANRGLRAFYTWVILSSSYFLCVSGGMYHIFAAMEQQDFKTKSSERDFLLPEYHCAILLLVHRGS